MDVPGELVGDGEHLLAGRTGDHRQNRVVRPQPDAAATGLVFAAKEPTYLLVYARLWVSAG